MSSHTLDLPDYRAQSPEVAARFAKLKGRPVVMRVSGLGKIFPTPGGAVTALEGIDFSVHRREFISVIGPSGCGKSTLIRILAGLETPSSGEVLLDDRAVTGPGPDRGMVFQGYTLFPWLTVKGNVMFGLKVTGHAQAQAESEAKQWIELVGLGKFEDSYPHQLSGGNEAACGHRPRAREPATYPANGRAVRRARRANPRADAGLSASDLAECGRHHLGHYP